MAAPPPHGRRAHRLAAIEALIGLTERLAVERRLSMSQAARVAIDNNWRLAADAATLSTRGIRPSLRALREHHDQERKAYAKIWPFELPPGMTEEEAYYWLEPYIPVGRRRKPRRSERTAVVALLDEGHPYTTVASLTGVPLATLYRWRPQRPSVRVDHGNR